MLGMSSRMSPVDASDAATRFSDSLCFFFFFFFSPSPPKSRSQYASITPPSVSLYLQSTEGRGGRGTDSVSEPRQTARAQRKPIVLEHSVLERRRRQRGELDIWTAQSRGADFGGKRGRGGGGEARSVPHDASAELGMDSLLQVGGVGRGKDEAAAHEHLFAGHGKGAGDWRRRFWRRGDDFRRVSPTIRRVWVSGRRAAGRRRHSGRVARAARVRVLRRPRTYLHNQCNKAQSMQNVLH